MEAEAYREAALLLPSAVQRTLTQLAESRRGGKDRLAGQRDMVRAVSALQDEFPVRAGKARLGVVFAEHPGTLGYVVPAIGLQIPSPCKGYPLRLTDGTVAYLSVPPWTLGWSFTPAGSGKKKRGGWWRHYD